MIYTANKKILGKVKELKGQMGGLPYAEIIPNKNSEVTFSSIEQKDKVSLNLHINTSIMNLKLRWLNTLS
jgi:hypothetical protein